MRDLPILFTSPVLPWPANQGSRRFLLESARALQCLGPVTWLTREIGDQSTARERLQAEGFELSLDTSFRGQRPWQRLRRRVAIDLRAHRRAVPRAEAFVSTPPLLEAARRWWEQHPDGLAVAAYWTAARTLESAPPGRRVLLAADVESDCLRMAQAGGFSTVEDRRIERLRRAESEAFTRADLVGFLTDEDRRAGRALLPPGCGTSTTIWPTFLPPAESVRPAPPTAEGLRVLVYGHWRADFNRDGLVWFLRDIWSPLSAGDPSVTLRVVGAGAPSIPVPGCEFVGYVEDLRAELERAHVVVLPLRFAGGMRYRLLEALGSGAAVVATGVAARGSGAVAGEHFLEANDLDGFVAAFDALTDPTRREVLGRCGREWVRRTHGTENRQSRVRRALSAVLEGGG